MSARVAKATVKAVFEQLDAAVRKGDYAILGQVTKIVTGKGEMIFRGKGPIIAQLESGALVFLTDWQGLPPIPELLDRPCPACADECSHCEGSGKNLCTLYGCGGRGVRRIRTKECTGAKCLAATGVTNLKCAVCRGRGTEFIEEQCPECKGDGKVKCAGCFGTGQRAEGVKDGKPCAACDGQGRKCKLTLQTATKFVDRQISGYAALGPIEALIWANLEDAMYEGGRNSRFAAEGDGRFGGGDGRGSRLGHRKDFVTCDVEPTEQGQPMYLFLQDLDAPTPMYLLGGRARIRE